MALASGATWTWASAAARRGRGAGAGRGLAAGAGGLGSRRRRAARRRRAYARPTSRSWRLRQQQVDRLEAACPGLEDVLPLSPLQEGLLFHALYAGSTPDVYTVQIIVVLAGVARCPPAAPRRPALLARHANLRARPSPMPAWTGRCRSSLARRARRGGEIDLSALPDQAQQARHAESAGGRPPPSGSTLVDRPPLLRFTLLRLAPRALSACCSPTTTSCWTAGRCRCLLRELLDPVRHRRGRRRTAAGAGPMPTTWTGWRAQDPGRGAGGLGGTTWPIWTERPGWPRRAPRTVPERCRQRCADRTARRGRPPGCTAWRASGA